MDLIGKGRDAKVRGGWPCVCRTIVSVPMPTRAASAVSVARQGELPLFQRRLALPVRRDISRERKTAIFSFADAYAPADFSALRFCEARVWSFFNRYVDGMENICHTLREKTRRPEPMPLFVKPNRLLSVQDVKDMMRDHYEGTPLALDNDPVWGLSRLLIAPRR